MEGMKRTFGDRRVQLGTVAALGALAVCGIAVAGADRLKPQPSGPELADHARLAIQMQAAVPPANVQPVGRLATLDASQINAVRASAEPVDPALQAVMDQERREAAEAVAEQRAFDARIRAEMNDSYGSAPERTAPPPSEPPAQRGGWTSNSEDVAPGA